MKQVRHLQGKETRGCKLNFGEYGLQVTEAGWIGNREIEAGRMAISRYIKRGGKVWIRAFPDKPLTKKPAETRMGSGKGATEEWVAEVRAGRIVFELTGVTPAIAKDAFERAASKMSLKTKMVTRSENLI